MRLKTKLIFFCVFIMISGAISAGATDIPADTYYSATGFDADNNNQMEFIDTGKKKLPAVEVPGQTGTYLQSNLGGMAAPMAYYPNVARELTDQGTDILIGNGTFQWPQFGSALEFRTKLYSTSGANALAAFYTTAIQAFTPKLLKFVEAEEYFRTAIRVDPYYEDALNGLLEVYYARAEGFMLIGNDYMAKAYRNKFERGPGAEQSLVDMEVEDIQSALVCYENGFREFMKLFNPEFTGLSQVRKPHLNIDPEWLFFERRFSRPGATVSFESLRGQKNAIGASSRALNSSGNEIGPVQGSPNLEFEIAVKTSRSAKEAKKAQFRRDLAENRRSKRNEQWNEVDAPIKFQLPIVDGAPTYEAGSSFTLIFKLDAVEPVQTIEMLIEFDHEKLGIGTPDFSNSAFSTNPSVYRPGEVFGSTQLLANQMLIRAEASASVTGTNKIVAKVPFNIISGKTGEFYVYATGSGGSLLSGYKDIAILYRLAAAHANATAEKIRRLYDIADESARQNHIDLIQKETARIGGWFEHIQTLLAVSATPEELANIDQLQSAINQVSAELNGLSALREFIRSGANVFGYPDDYVPFYNVGETDTFDAVRNMVTGSGTTPQTYGGFFGTARETETAAVLTRDKWKDTKDRIRNELFTINEQAENRLAQVCGRVDRDGEASLSASDDIDYDMIASPGNLACEIGQNVLLLQRAQKVLEQADADIQQYIEDIELEKGYLVDAIDQHENKVQVMEEYQQMQDGLNKEIKKVTVKQMRLKAVAQAAVTVVQGSSNAVSWFTGESYGQFVAAAIQLANGLVQANMEKKKLELQADKERLGAEERIKLTQIDTELFKLQETKIIEQMLNDVVLKQIAAQIAEIDIQLALGQLHKLIAERDELLARRGRALANLGEMSFADPSFRLTQFNAMKDAETHLEFLKRWLYVMTRSLYYKWAVQEDYVIRVYGLPEISIRDIPRIQVVGALNEGIGQTPLGDELTAADYVEALLAFNDAGPMAAIVSPVSINRTNSNNSARFSLREDFLRIVRTQDTAEERTRVREAFRSWLSDSDRYDADGNLVIEFNTLSHLENYDLPVNDTHSTWKNFALRSYSNRPLWNHKIDKIGVAIKALGSAFRPGTLNVTGSLEYGGVGYIKGDSDAADDFRAYQMRQWRDIGNGRLEPVDVRTADVTIPTSSSLEGNEGAYMVLNLRERPVAATLWRLFVPANQVANIELNNIEDIYIYIYSSAYQRQ